MDMHTYVHIYVGTWMKEKDKVDGTATENVATLRLTLARPSADLQKDPLHSNSFSEDLCTELSNAMSVGVCVWMCVRVCVCVCLCVCVCV